MGGSDVDKLGQCYHNYQVHSHSEDCLLYSNLVPHTVGGKSHVASLDSRRPEIITDTRMLGEENVLSHTDRWI